MLGRAGWPRACVTRTQLRKQCYLLGERRAARGQTQEVRAAPAGGDGNRYFGGAHHRGRAAADHPERILLGRFVLQEMRGQAFASLALAAALAAAALAATALAAALATALAAPLPTARVGPVVRRWPQLLARADGPGGAGRRPVWLRLLRPLHRLPRLLRWLRLRLWLRLLRRRLSCTAKGMLSGRLPQLADGPHRLRDLSVVRRSD